MRIGTWLLRHGVIRLAMILAGKLGDKHARISHDPAARVDPYPLYRQMREDGTGFYRGLITVAAVSHGTVSALLRNDALKVGFDLPGVPWILRRALTRGRGELVGPIDYPSLLVVNPPEHTKYRRQVHKVFTPRAIAQLDDHIRAACHALLDDLEKDADGGVVDLVDRYAGLLPVTVICDILGIPNAMREKFLDWGNAGAMSLDIGLSHRDYLACENGIRELNAWMYGHIARLRENPTDDLLSRLVHAEDEGTRMTDTQIMATVSLLLAAGFETTVNMISGGVFQLATHPDQLKLLAEDPDLWPNAVEEILRYDAPVQETLRVATEKVVINGFTVRKGDFVGVMLGAANRDPAVFENPDEFDVRRRNARDHLSFSAGVHFCIGSVLARAEGRMALEILFERYPELAIEGEPSWRNTRTLRGFRHLPVRMGPPAPADRVEITPFDLV